VDKKISQRNHRGSVPAAAFAVQAKDDSTMCFGHCVIWFASSLLGHERPFLFRFDPSKDHSAPRLPAMAFLERCGGGLGSFL